MDTFAWQSLGDESASSTRSRHGNNFERRTRANIVQFKCASFICCDSGWIRVGESASRVPVLYSHICALNWLIAISQHVASNSNELSQAKLKRSTDLRRESNLTSLGLAQASAVELCPSTNSGRPGLITSIGR